MRPICLSCLSLLAVACLACWPSRDHATGAPVPPREGAIVSEADPFTGLLVTEAHLPWAFKHGVGPKPPVAGFLKLENFPQPPAPPKVVPPDAARVLRVQPTGEIQNTRAITVAFSQPMVPLASVEQMRALPIPATLEPELPGRWRWLGTSLLAFEPTSRLPRSTHFTVTIPRGARSALGTEISETKRFTFSTPPLHVTDVFPDSDGALPETPIVLYFDQRVDPKLLAPFIQVELSGADGEPSPVRWRLLSREQFEKNELVKKYELEWREHATLALLPEKPLMKDREYSVTLRIGAPSAEGPRVTKVPFSKSFTTLGPMKLVRLTCVGRSRQPCRPNFNWHFEFTNEVAAEDEEPSIARFFKVTPAVKDLKVELWGSTGNLSGDFKPDTTYNVTVLAGIEDTYKQKLGASHTTTIRVDDDWPDFQMPSEQMAVQEDTRRVLSVPAVNNLKPADVRVFSLSPKDFFYAMNVSDQDYHPDGFKDPTVRFGPPVATWKIPLNIKRNVREVVPIELERALNRKNGVLFVEINSPSLRIRRDDITHRFLVLQVTSHGITVTHDKERLHILTTGLSDGKARGSVPLRMYQRPAKSTEDALLVWEGQTGADGTVMLPWPAKVRTSERHFIIVAGKATDLAFLPVLRQDKHGGYDSTYQHQTGPRSQPPRLRAMVFTDRNPYRPGEPVELTGWLREETVGPEGRLGALTVDPSAKVELRWVLVNPENETVEKGVTPIDRDGTFHVRWRSPEDAMLGTYWFKGSVNGVIGMPAANVQGQFSVLAYRTPEHVVDVSIPPNSYIYGEKLLARVEGRYTFGAPMRKADVSYAAVMQGTSYQPPGHPEYEFGVSNHYWRYRTQSRLFSGRANLDDQGFFNLEEVIEKPANTDMAMGPSLILMEAVVTDVNRQSISAQTRTTVHPAAVYTGLRTPQNLIREGDAAVVEGVVVDIGGRRIAGRPVKVRARLQAWKRKPADRIGQGDGDYEDVYEEKAACTFTSSEKPAACAMTIAAAGVYQLEGETIDLQGRAAITRTELYVLGKEETGWTPENEKVVKLVPERDDGYLPGEKMKLIVRAPFYPATGVLSLEREGLVTSRLIHVKSPMHMEEILIEEKMIPNLWVSVSLVRGRVKEKPGAHEDSGRPMMATGGVKIPIRLDSKKIKVAVKPDKDLIRPGETVTLDLTATDDAGAPVQARLAVMLVDEGVLSLLDYQLPDPLALFFPQRSAQTWKDDLRTSLLRKPVFSPPEREEPDLEPPDDQDGSYSYGIGSGMGSIVGSGGGGFMPANTHSPHVSMLSSSNYGDSGGRGRSTGGGSGLDAVALRSFFASTAYFNNQVLVDAGGRVRLKIPMPENLTTFRVMIVAMDTKAADRFGAADGRITVRKDFMVRAALPRFANFGDTFEAAVVLNSMNEKEGAAEVKLSGSGFEVLGPDVRSVNLSSKKSEEVRFRVTTAKPGLARFSFSARHLDQTDGVRAPAIPVHVPASTENTAVYGSTDGAVLQPIVPPGKVFPQFGGLDVHLSSTGLSGLQDAAKFLLDNDYECSEAIASRLVPIFALKDIIPRFGLGNASDEKKLNSLAVKGIAELLKYQTRNGGFRLWPGGTDSWAFSSAYITWSLVRAREAGFAVPDNHLREAARFLIEVLKGHYNHEQWWYYSYSTQIYAGWVLTELARLKVLTPRELDEIPLRHHLERLFKLRDKVGFLARTQLLHALWRLDGLSAPARTLLRELENSAVETAAGAHFAETVTEGQALLMHSEARTDAVVLRVLLDIDPRHILLPKIVRGLMSSRVDGGWGSSQGNAFVLDALAAYFRVVEAEEPDFSTHAWYDRLYAGGRRFKGRSMDVVHARIPMKTLLAQGAGGLLLTKDGPGRLYYRLGLAYVPVALDLPPENQGIAVTRTYESMDDDERSVVRLSPGRWQVRAGTTVLVKITLTVPDRRSFVALTDPFPAGFEGVDHQMTTAPQLAPRKRTGSSVTSGSHFWWWHAPSHQELRDDRFVAYYDNLYAGTYEYAYMARATTLGVFSAPPARALEMYHPEVFGRTGRETVEVVP